MSEYRQTPLKRTFVIFVALTWFAFIMYAAYHWR